MKKVEVKTYSGTEVGYFLDPKICKVAEHHFEIQGNFYETDGSLNDRIAFNPEALPYIAEIPKQDSCEHTSLLRTYVQRARQPVSMVGICKTREIQDDEILG